MALLRLDPFIFLDTPLGVAEAHFLRTDDGFEVPYLFGCFQCETKENWWWGNHHVRLRLSISAGRDGEHSPIHLDDAMLETLGPHILRHKKSPLYARAAQYLRGEA